MLCAMSSPSPVVLAILPANAAGRTSTSKPHNAGPASALIRRAADDRDTGRGPGSGVAPRMVGTALYDDVARREHRAALVQLEHELAVDQDHEIDRRGLVKAACVEPRN